MSKKKSVKKTKLNHFIVYAYAPVHASASIRVLAANKEDAKEIALDEILKDDSNVEWYYEEAYVDSGDIDEDQVKIGEVYDEEDV